MGILSHRSSRRVEGGGVMNCRGSRRSKVCLNAAPSVAFIVPLSHGQSDPSTLRRQIDGKCFLSVHIYIIYINMFSESTFHFRIGGGILRAAQEKPQSYCADVEVSQCQLRGGVESRLLVYFGATCCVAAVCGSLRQPSSSHELNQTQISHEARSVGLPLTVHAHAAPWWL